MYTRARDGESRRKSKYVEAKTERGVDRRRFFHPSSPPTDILNFIVVEERCEIKMAAAGGMRTLPSRPSTARICRY